MDVAYSFSDNGWERNLFSYNHIFEVEFWGKKELKWSPMWASEKYFL